MGKKPSGKKNLTYFGEKEEKAVVDYLNAKTLDEKSFIYSNFLKTPFSKMISSIIRRYNLQRKGYTFEEVFNDTESFLITKMNMFDPTKNFKAYSYYGTTCRNYLTGLLTKDGKEKTKKISYDEIPKVIDDENHAIKYNDAVYVERETLIIKKLLERIKNIQVNNNLDANEEKILFALIEIFSNYENLFNESVKNNNKFNKSLILLFIKDLTNLNLKEIRCGMKKFKNVYKDIILEINQ